MRPRGVDHARWRCGCTHQTLPPPDPAMKAKSIYSEDCFKTSHAATHRLSSCDPASALSIRLNRRPRVITSPTTGTAAGVPRGDQSQMTGRGGGEVVIVGRDEGVRGEEGVVVAGGQKNTKSKSKSNSQKERNSVAKIKNREKTMTNHRRNKTD